MSKLAGWSRRRQPKSAPLLRGNRRHDDELARSSGALPLLGRTEWKIQR